MKKRKTLQDLTIKDNFLFGAVMSVEENCKGFLEMVLGFSIAQVVVSKEKSIVYHPEYKGVRLDIYAEDENHTHYNVEMQMKKKTALGKRSRYYHSQMVMEALTSGEDYETMPDTFVIFVCDFDPFGEHLYCYTFGNECREKKNVKLDDGSCTIFLSTRGENEEEVPAELVRFLKFVTADLEESEEDFQDKLVKRFQETIHNIKADREMGERYMIFEEMLREEKQEGRQEGLLEGRIEGRIEATREGIFELLEDLGEVPDKLRDRMEALEELGDLKFLFKLAVKADSIQNFVKDAENYLQTKEKHE
ncbi:MAG: Rpn family recombination-promoting nuclease/putative transposase [Blautia sp.]|uniref:Rpn family recombination-promoting nuclease/putative transposase n=1 Tax=Blautia sp. TaxID=1955243 RepID=UPI002E798325|nr:Rpn family recombination-promoting nuclease/putative transposase [Blautia sp.]MEE1442516.1 Rpn family recombination-promoting nuclease/putative transposase [Blautia sp.]